MNKDVLQLNRIWKNPYIIINKLQKKEMQVAIQIWD